MRVFRLIGLRLVVAAGFVAMHLSAAAPVAGGARAADSGIAEEGFVRIGGIEQWITIHGDNRDNPVIVVLHGGPGEAQTPLETLYAGWQRQFTVVQWDQRGAGKTFGRNGKATPDMTLDRMVQDAVEVADYARQRLGVKKVILLGHSWGALLGVNVIKKRPDLFCAYVGTGQVVGWAQGMAAQYKYTVSRAKAERNEDAIRELKEIGSPPYEIGPKFFTAHKWLNRYLPASDTKYIQQQMDIIRSAPNFSKQDIQDWEDGEDFSGRQLYSVEVAEDLSTTLGYQMPVPFFIIDGEQDHIAPVEVARGYFHKIKAPQKRMILIKGAGHFAYATNRDQFLAALVKYVRPLGVSPGADAAIKN